MRTWWQIIPSSSRLWNVCEGRERSHTSDSGLLYTNRDFWNIVSIDTWAILLLILTSRSKANFLYLHFFLPSPTPLLCLVRLWTAFPVVAFGLVLLHPMLDGGHSAHIVKRTRHRYLEDVFTRELHNYLICPWNYRFLKASIFRSAITLNVLCCAFAPSHEVLIKIFLAMVFSLPSFLIIISVL